jgi:hypothetical protein
MKNWYNILGVSRDASANGIKLAYRTLTSTRHPDTKDNVEAYEILSDPVQRAEYDGRPGAGTGSGNTSSSHASGVPGSREAPADDADKEPEAFNIQIIPSTVDFGIVMAGAKNVNSVVTLSWDRGSPYMIRRSPSGGDWWDISDVDFEAGRATFTVSAKVTKGISGGSHTAHFDIVVDNVAHRVELVMSVRQPLVLSDKEIFVYRGSWLLATVAAFLLSEYVDHFFNPAGSPPAGLAFAGGLWNIIVVVYGLSRIFRRKKLISIFNIKMLWMYASCAVIAFAVGVALLWTYKNGISGWS